MIYNAAVTKSVLSGVVLLLVTSLWGCSGGQADVASSLRVEGVTTGWLDAGIDEYGRNKLVPTISFHLQNVSETSVGSLQLNGVFRRCLRPGTTLHPNDAAVSPADPEAGTCPGEVQEWGSAYLRAVGREGIDPGRETDPFTMQSSLGYTGQQPRLEMLQHREFVDVKVELFVRHGSEQWARLGEHLIERQLLTQ